MADKQTFAEDLREWMYRHELTAEQASNLLNIKRRTLENWRQGRTEPMESLQMYLRERFKTAKIQKERKRTREKSASVS